VGCFIGAALNAKFIVALRFRPSALVHHGVSRGVNGRLTITSRDLLKRNYNSMNQAFLSIIVKIRGSIFTIPTRFVD
jgi:hypothetical protein